MNVPSFDVLESFFYWWIQGWRGGLFPSLHDGITHVGPYTGLILYRKPPFQVQLWILPPNVESPEHGHPGVDTFLVHVSGQIYLWVDGKEVLTPEQNVEGEDGVSKVNGNFIRLHPDQKHKAASGPLGGAFMVLQHWLDGKPRSTEEAWTGSPIDEEHKKKLFENSVRKTFGSATKVDASIFQKEPDMVPLKVDSNLPCSMPLGLESSVADEVKSGAASTNGERSLAH